MRSRQCENLAHGKIYRRLIFLINLQHQMGMALLTYCISALPIPRLTAFGATNMQPEIGLP